MIKRVIVLSHEAMEEFVGANAERKRTVMPSTEHGYISILAPHWAKIFKKNSDHVITLVFDDISREYPDTLVEGRILTLFSDDQAKQLIDFVEEFNKRPTDDTMYVHCRQGVSRSGAVGTFINEICELDSSQFNSDNPQLKPNPHVLNLLTYHWNERQRKNRKNNLIEKESVKRLSEAELQKRIADTEAVLMEYQQIVARHKIQLESAKADVVIAAINDSIQHETRQISKLESYAQSLRDALGGK